MFKRFLDKIVSAASSVPFDTLIWAICASFAAIFLIVLVVCKKNIKVNSASKRPFLCLVNAYTAIITAAFLTAYDISQSLFAAALFWVVGYLFYGALCLLTKKKVRQTAIMQPVLTAMPTQTPKPTVRADVPAAKSSVRLEHAISVTDKLLCKNLGKGDRQELEKLKNTLAVLQMKGTLSPVESDILNDNFNALLKLMAKYNV